MEIDIKVSMQVNNMKLNLKVLFFCFFFFFKIHSAVKGGFMAKSINEGISWYVTLNVSSVFY